MADYKSLGHIIAVIHRYTQVYLADALKDLDLYGPGQVRIVLILAKEQEGISQDELAKKLLVDKATISRMIRPLIRNGIVTRERNAADRRAYLIRLTDNVKKKIPKIRGRARKWTGILGKGLDRKDLDKLFTYLEKIENNARDYIKERNNKKTGTICQNPQIGKTQNQ